VEGEVNKEEKKGRNTGVEGWGKGGKYRKKGFGSTGEMARGN